MTNSMDSILVRYGIPVTEQEQNLIDYSFLGKKTRRGVKTVTIPEFLKVPKNQLSEMEQKIQQAIRLVYELNGKEPPLYQKFPNFRPDKPLTIDIILSGKEKENYAAVYEQGDNKIVFETVRTPENLVENLAHELKHAEQYDEEVQRLDKELDRTNAYGWHQLRFLREAQAFATGARAYYEIYHTPIIGSYGNIDLYADLSQKYTLPDGQKDFQKIEVEMVKKLLPRLYKGEYYKEKFDKVAPIGENDTGLDHIPLGLHLPQILMETLPQIPTEAAGLEGKVYQSVKNKKWDDYFTFLKQLETQHLHKMIIETLPGILPNMEIPGHHVLLPITENDLIGASGNVLLLGLNDFSPLTKLFNFVKMLPNVLKLKGKKGKPLVKEHDLADKFSEYIYYAPTPEGLQKVLKRMMDDKGRLPLSRKAFHIHGTHLNGQNRLLTELLAPESLQVYPYNDKNEYYSGILPILMSLKDNRGLAIISEENIRNFPDDHPWAEAVKAYLPKRKARKKTGLKNTLIKGEKRAISRLQKQKPPKQP